MRLTSESWRRPACLPGPGLQDAGIEADLAGYGEYFRSTCQTDARGPMKHHYCQTDPLCMSDQNCPPKFSDGLKSYHGCSKKERTPARWSRLCSKFLYESKFEFRVNVDEVHLLEMDLEGNKEQGQYLETCYRQEPGQYGWCRYECEHKSFLTIILKNLRKLLHHQGGRRLQDDEDLNRLGLGLLLFRLLSE